MEFTDRFQSGMIFICDAHGRLLSANPPALAALKLSQEQAAGLSVDGLFESRPPKSLLPFINADAPARVFCDLLGLGGRKTVDLYVEPLQDVGGGMSGAILAARDLPAYAADVLNGPVPKGSPASGSCESQLAAISEDLEIARAVQLAMLPDMHTLTGLTIAAAYLPNMAVGGDFYDAFPITPDRMAILMFDVAGHGVSAGLYAAMAKSLFSRYVTRQDSPSEVFYRVNRELSRLSGLGKYLTAFLGFYDVKERMLTYSGAGHPAPLHLASNGTLNALHGKPAFLGMYGDENPEDTLFGDLCMPLKAGDRLCVYTDGLIEAADPARRLFGPDALKRVIANGLDKSPQELLDAVMGAVQTHMNGAPPSDDITVMVLGVQ